MSYMCVYACSTLSIHACLHAQLFLVVHVVVCTHAAPCHFMLSCTQMCCRCDASDALASALIHANVVRRPDTPACAPSLHPSFSFFCECGVLIILCSLRGLHVCFRGTDLDWEVVCIVSVRWCYTHARDVCVCRLFEHAPCVVWHTRPADELSARLVQATKPTGCRVLACYKCRWYLFLAGHKQRG